MSEPSKLVKSWVTASCSEVFHPKTQHCGPHFSKIFRGVFWRSVQLYAPFFLVMRLLNGRNIFKLESLKSFVKSVLRGSLFLSIDGPVTVLLCCSARNLLGYHAGWAVFLACFIGTYLGISVEDESRQRELTIYTSSVAADTAFRMLVSRGLAVPIKHGRALIFLAGMALTGMLHAEKRTTPGTHQSTMNWIAGKRVTEEPHIISNSIDRYLLPALGMNRDTLKNSSHKDLIYVVSGFARGFVAGFGLRLMGMLLSRKFTMKAFQEKLRFSSFLSLLSGLYRLGIVLTSKRGESSPMSGLFSGIISGLAAFIYPSIELSMYTSAKTVDALIRSPPPQDAQSAQQPPQDGKAPDATAHPHHRRRSPRSTQLVKLTFAFACALVWYCVCFENHNVRPSYMKFLHVTSDFNLNQLPGIAAKMGKELGIPNLTPKGAFD